MVESGEAFQRLDRTKKAAEADVVALGVSRIEQPLVLAAHSVLRAPVTHTAS
ncbi:hypothetical protein [Micromonospora sp. NPDC005299]|uniref:hypothetical protein n=1 Tax=Micromonospora sp. NPDC005299 TaxID=3364231 RepID=UPI003697AB57